ncbi:hypothetical protein PJ985_05965 [Streptomyces sp. ACA25]|uniref:hypothetical protein n=1 Tax=Streptomyces sp. ACA25 TaxID=3022596 RepID=UPI002306F8A3|nr:hypothetical protein [Streptomyces sp. ACA25]MDB1087112.1 hypothetical protein [Streptomyces sp. ACA25]
MTRIRIPGEELADVLVRLQQIRDRIEKTASLSSAGSDEDVGDRRLLDAVHGFDGAWGKGHKRVQENVDTFHEAVQGILDAFEETDIATSQALEESSSGGKEDSAS